MAKNFVYSTMHASRYSLSRVRVICIMIACAVLAGLPYPATAGPNDIYIEGGGGDYTLNKGKSLLDMRFRHIVRQRYDFSCGSAAIATLLTYHYGHPVSENDVLMAMFVNGDQDKIRKQGFSLLDMKNYFNSIGYHAEGYKESLDKLAKVGIPSIALINKHGYLHFVVITGVTKDKVATSDPTLGIRIYTRQDFEKMWNGIIFVVLNNKNIAHASFNTADNWSPYGSPHFRHMLDQGELSSLTINISLTPNYY